MGERPIAGQRSIWVCVFRQTHIQVSLFSFVDCSEVNGSVLLGVLLIKSLPSKCISQIRLDINKFFFLNTDQCALKKIKKGEEEEEDSMDDKRQERLYH